MIEFLIEVGKLIVNIGVIYLLLLAISKWGVPKERYETDVLTFQDDYSGLSRMSGMLRSCSARGWRVVSCTRSTKGIAVFLERRIKK